MAKPFSLFNQRKVLIKSGQSDQGVQELLPRNSSHPEGWLEVVMVVGGWSLKADAMVSLEEDKGHDKRGIHYNNWVVVVEGSRINGNTGSGQLNLL